MHDWLRTLNLNSERNTTCSYKLVNAVDILVEISSWKLIDYFKSLEIYTLKTFHLKKTKNTDSKNYSLNVQRLHMS